MSHGSAIAPTEFPHPVVRRTIGFLTASLRDPYATATWTDVMAAAAARGADVINLVTARLKSPVEFEAPAQVLYDLVDRGRLDGLVVFSEMLYHFVGAAELGRFLARYTPLPMTSIGVVAGVPSVMLDIEQGMRELVAHLVETHGYRRLAYLRGPAAEPAAEALERGYCLGLAEHRIPAAPHLMAPHPPTWGAEVGEQGARLLLDERGLRPGADFDAVIACGDLEALAFIDALQARGIRVPFDVAVTGYNNLEPARLATPSLTTVDRRISEVARRATEMLFDLLDSQAPPTEFLQPELVIRRSCGCVPQVVLRAGRDDRRPETADHRSPTDDRRPATGIHRRSSVIGRQLPVIPRAPLLAAIAHAGRPGQVGVSAGLDPLWAERLLDSFLADLDETAAIGFLTTLEETLRQVLAAERSVSAWHEVLSALRSAVQPLLEPKRLARAENLWQQARVLIGDFAERAQGRRQLAAASQVQTLNDITQSLITTFDVNGLLDVLARDLPQLGIPACYLALYEDPGTPAGGARLLLAYDEAGRLSIEPGGRRVPTRCLVPPSAELGNTFNVILSESPLTSRDGEPLAKNPSLHSGQVLLTATRPFAELAPERTSRDQLAQGDTDGAPGTSSGFLPVRRDWVALPLYFQGEQLGLVVFEMGPHDGSVYEALRVQISSALKGALLATRNVELYREAVAARQVAEEADQLKSRFLSTVSHELRTPLSLIVGTIEMLLREQPDRPSDLPAPYQRDLRSIHSSARHLARLISDVLDLASSQAGELHLVREPLHLDEVLAQAALLGDALAREKGLSWQSDIPAGLPLVWGDRTRLQQVVLNLVSNAVKFTERGNVRLWAERGRRQVVIAVSDSGLGIPAAEQEFIFDEFRQSERAARRGYGGMGLGLAISRRLVELHGGQIGVLSTGAEGAGSTFYFTLPIMQTDAAAVGGGEDRSGTVLLLTEHVDRGSRLAGHLADQGYTVEVMPLTDHPNWFGQIITAPPGAIVLDFAPGAERGLELMQLLQRAPTTHNIPVIFYTLAEAEGRGAALAFDLLAKPAAAADLLAALARQGIDADQAHGRILLVVDDDPGILDLHARLLEELAPRCRILKARNGQEALALMTQQRPDLVLLDLMMPVLDGFGVLEAMHARETLRGIPVIVLTAQVLTGQEMARLQQGVAAVLHKGLFTGPEVLAQVTEALDRNKRLGSAAQRVVRQAMAYIHQHYAEPITREALAQAVGFSDRYLTQCFRAETGLTPVAYLSRYRIKQARGLLESGEGSITEIALATGFTDPSYFARVFREVVGVTPRAYQHGERGG